MTGLPGTLNAPGSTVTLTDWYGSNLVYQYDSAKKAYAWVTPMGVSVSVNSRALSTVENT